MPKKQLFKTTIGWRVIATVTDPDFGDKVLKPISGNFAIKEAAQQFVEIAKKDYPDAYIQEVMKREKSPFPFS